MSFLTRRASSRVCLALATLGVLTACDGVLPGTGPDVRPEDAISPLAQTYLNEVLGVMQQHAMRRRAVNWFFVRTNVFAVAGSAQTIEGTFPAIREALRLLGDGHSSYRAVNGTFLFVPTRTCQSPAAPTPTDLPADIRIRTGAQLRRHADAGHAVRRQSAGRDSTGRS